MRPSTTSFARLIKFVGGKHPRPEVVDASVKQHPMSAGLIPGGEGTLQISALNWPKFEVVPPPKKNASSTQKNSTSTPTSSKPFDFVSVKELPKRFQTPPFDELEMDVVNSGGADLVF